MVSGCALHDEVPVDSSEKSMKAVNDMSKKAGLRKKVRYGLAVAIVLIGMMPMTAMATEAENKKFRTPEGIVGSETVEVLEDIIETATYPIVVGASTYDYDTVEDTLYDHILLNNTDMTEEEALLLAHELIEKTREINESLASMSARRSVDETSMEGIYYLGRITDGELVEGVTTFATGYDQIIPGDLVSAPTRTKHTLTVKYVETWYGFDSYKSSAGGKYTLAFDVSASLQLGWTATGGLIKTVAESFGISTTPTTTVTSKLSSGFEIVANPWTKTLMRPYIYYYVDTYSGIRGFHCFSSITGEYFYMTDEVYGQDINLLECSIRTWSRENIDKDPYATSPLPPAGWEW